MSYGQINYSQNLGTGPSVDTIADVGCFLTAFCNLLERFGEPIDPPTLNNYFIAHGSYLPDGPDRDNLGWGSVAAYDGNIIPSQIGGAGWPPNNDSIVKFIYKSARTGQSITHFCLVVDHSAGTILDSWDGHVKHTPYGNPVAWATYERHQPQVVTPPPPVEAAAFTVENIAPKTVQLTKNTHMWDLNQRSWPGIVNNPVGDGADGATFTTSRVAHQILGGSYYLPDGEDSHGYNEVDCRDYTTPAPPKPAAPPLRPGGNPDMKYTVIKTIPGYGTATNAGNHVSPLDEVAPGDYFIYNTHSKNSDLINVTSILGQPGSWINKADNVEEAPPEPPAPEVPAVPEPPVASTIVPPAPEAPADTLETPPVDSTAPVGWQETYRPFPKPIHYIATRNLVVSDLADDQKQPDMPLPRYDDTGPREVGVVSAYGTVSKNGIDYYRLMTNNDPDFKFWYCIPKIDPDTHTPNLLVKTQTPGNPIDRLTVARDTIHLAKSRFETDLPKFLDDMVPKFLRNKNKK